VIDVDPSLSEFNMGTETFEGDEAWAGRPLTTRGYVALNIVVDAPVDRRQTPRPIFAAAGAGEGSNVLISPERLGEFILAHRRARFVLHDVGRRFWLVDAHLEGLGEAEARRAWWDAADQNRMADTMLLDQLIGLARRDAEPRHLTLSEVARHYIDLEMGEEGPPRRRHDEIAAAESEEQEPEVRRAIREAVVILEVYRRMLLEAQRLVIEHGGVDIRPDAPARYGPLTEAIQVKAAVALATIERVGMCVDLGRVRQAEAALRAHRDAAAEALRSTRPALFAPTPGRGAGAGSPPATASGGAVLREDMLQAELARVLADLRRATGEEIEIPRTSNGALTTRQEAWSGHAHLHPFLEKWIALKDAEKHIHFLSSLRVSPVHADYRCLVRTGRTACSGPNLQQVARDGLVRHAFVPSAGHLLLSVDYSAIDLRALAAVCLHRYGRSALAEVFRRGIDPHAHTAATILGLPLEEFRRWKGDRSVAGRRRVAGREEVVTFARKFREMRAAAKAVNFGVPAGLGAASLVEYARGKFGVRMSIEEARRFRDTLTESIYPELALYLAEDEMATLARNLGTTELKLREALAAVDPAAAIMPAGLRDMLAGLRFGPRMPSADPDSQDRLWRELARLCTNPELRRQLASGLGSEMLASRLFGKDVATLSGRIRGGVDHGAGLNTPFQGLAADGAKLALWRLVREGGRVVLFLHDEVLIEVPDEGGFVSKQVVDRYVRIMCEEMAAVLGGDIPVECESALMTRWSKDAESIVRDGKVYPWDPGPGDA
jgi:hypothetical protein